MLVRPFQGRGARGEEERDEDDRDTRDIRHAGPPAPSAVPDYRHHRHATADFTEADDDDDEDESNHDGAQQRFRATTRSRSEHGEDGPSQSAGVLPLFAGNHLGMSVERSSPTPTPYDTPANGVPSQTCSQYTA